MGSYGRHHARGSAIRIPPRTRRAIWNDESEDAEVVIVSKRIADPQADAETIDGLWPAE